MRNRLARMTWALMFAVFSISLGLLHCESDDSSASSPLPPPPDAAHEAAAAADSGAGG